MYSGRTTLCARATAEAAFASPSRVWCIIAISFTLSESHGFTDAVVLDVHGLPAPSVIEIAVQRHPLVDGVRGEGGRPQHPGDLPRDSEPSFDAMPHVSHLLQEHGSIRKDSLPYAVDRFAHLVGCVRGPGDLRRRREALVHLLLPRVGHSKFLRARGGEPASDGPLSRCVPGEARASRGCPSGAARTSPRP